MRGIIFAAILAGLICTASPIGAAPVNYDEAVSGDLPFTGSPLPTFTLDVGANTVSGTNGLFDADSFAFIVPAGTRLLAGQVQLTDAVGDPVAADWQLRSGSNAGFGSFFELLGDGSPGIDTLTTVPLGPGTYHFVANFFGGNECPCAADYTFTLTLRAVAEPSTLAFLTLGLASLTLARRGRRSS